MISQDRLRILARELGVRQGYAEKNYVNSWLLWGIFTSDYGDNLLFKGGAALSKLYFPQSWRFSEDLDFGVEGEYQGSKQELRAVLDTITDRSGIEFEMREHHESQQDHYLTRYVDTSIHGLHIPRIRPNYHTVVRLKRSQTQYLTKHPQLAVSEA